MLNYAVDVKEKNESSRGPFCPQTQRPRKAKNQPGGLLPQKASNWLQVYRAKEIETVSNRIPGH